MSASRKRSRGSNYTGLTRRDAPSAFSSNTDVVQNRKIKALQTQVAKLSKSEDAKYVGKGFTWNPNNSGQITPMTNPPLFTGDQTQRYRQREGQSVVTTQFMMKGNVFIDQSALSADANNRVRMIIVLSKDSGVIQGQEDILNNPGNLDSFYRIDPPNPYSILYDRTFQLQSTEQLASATVSSTSTEPWRIPFNIKLGKKAFGKTGCKATWLKDDGTTVQARTGGISIILYSDSTLPSHPTVQGAYRWRFLDQ